ncbi:hypothetical protein LY90DRAFT_167303 [Neocallimastix californiae]|uniref:Uncharacterized protein n=1 Tax=Neocallimastix californiae TaxID=1754190 RepID=A0A1Y2EQE5_9FUNG|nr:hypothetical protein LY90DRAFT_167303 [Neocallimastix californiae]|eukprot:ORY73757.1 hypothetical protein LY90DRAFT_167303 [Neocallimastix californiae]
MHFLQINNGNDDYSKKSNFQKEINNCDYFQNNNIEEYNIQIEPYLLNINNNYCNINKNNNEILLENDYNLLFFENNEYYDNINNKNFLDINDNKNSESLNLKINYNTNNNTNYGRQQYNQNYKNFPFLDLDNTRSISKPNIINNLKSNFHDYKEELNFNLLEIYEPNIINDDRINKQNLINNEYDYSCISNKILFLKKDLEKSLIYTVQNYGVGSYNIKLIDDIKDLICQIDLVLQKFTSQDYISQNKIMLKLIVII